MTKNRKSREKQRKGLAKRLPGERLSLYEMHLIRKAGSEHQAAEGRSRPQSEEKYKRIYNAAMTPIFTTAANGAIIEMNPACVSMLGYESLGEIKEITATSTYVNQNDRNKLLEEIKKGPVRGFETRLRRKDGRQLDVMISAYPLTNEYGLLTGLQGSMTDITEFKRNEEAIRESETRYRRLFETSPISLWQEDFSEVKRYFDNLRARGIGDINQHFSEHPDELAKCASKVRILDVNEATLKLFGARSVDQLLGELRRVLTQEFQENFREELLALWKGETRFSTEFDNQTLTGETKHVNVFLNVIPGYENTLAKVLVSIIDLTELRETRQRLEHAVASNPAAIYVAKPLPDYSDWTLTYISDRITTLTGFEPSDFIGHPELWENRSHPDDRALVREENRRIIENGKGTVDYRFLHKDGTYRWMREQVKVIRDAHGKPVEVDGYWTDITDLKKMEHRLAENQRSATIGETAAMVGHDLRNPLQGIAAAASLLEQESLTAQERKELLQVIQKSVDYSDSIIRDLSEYSTEIQLKTGEDTAKSIVQSTIEAFKIPGNITVLDRTQTEPTFGVDSDRMRRVFINLIQNAVDAMPRGGSLTISSRKIGNEIEIDFADTGSGFPEKIMENLWKPLQTTKAKGMGLGLSICKRIVEAHRGKISVKSGNGEGTTVTIRLPTDNKPVKEQRSVQIGRNN